MIEISSKYKAVVFDLGGTLMEYKGMPLNWNEYYERGFRNVSDINSLNIDDNSIKRSAEILRSFNPRTTGREQEIAPEILFGEACAGWSHRPDMEKLIDDFFSGMKLDAVIFEYTEELLRNCKAKGLRVACYTDLPNGMPDRLFRKNIMPITELLDLYVSSETCGFRKPNPQAVVMIAETFGVGISEILLVGDEVKDQCTAENAGCGFVFISDLIKS